MAEQWCYKQNNEQHGPVSSEQLKQLASRGQIQPTDLICKQGTDQWIPAGRVKGLLPASSPKVPSVQPVVESDTPPPVPRNRRAASAPSDVEESDAPPPLPRTRSAAPATSDDVLANIAQESLTVHPTKRPRPKRKKSSFTGTMIAVGVVGVVAILGIAFYLSQSGGQGDQRSKKVAAKSESQQSASGREAKNGRLIQSPGLPGANTPTDIQGTVNRMLNETGGVQSKIDEMNQRLADSVASDQRNRRQQEQREAEQRQAEDQARIDKAARDAAVFAAARKQADALAAANRTLSHEGIISRMAFTPDGKHLLSAVDTIRTWDLEAWKQVAEFSIGEISCVDFSHDGRRALTLGTLPAENVFGMTYWDIASGKELRRIRIQLGNNGTAVAISPDGRYGMGINGGGFSVWDLHTGNEVSHFGEWWQAVDCITISRSGRQALIGGSSKQGNEFWFVDMDNNRQPAKFGPHRFEVKCAVLSSDAQFAISIDTEVSSSKSAARLWNLRTKREVQVAWARHMNVDVAVFSPDGHLVALAGRQLDRTGVERGTVCLWNMQDGRELTTFVADASTIGALAFSDDGRQLAYASQESRIWVKKVPQSGDNAPHNGTSATSALPPVSVPSASPLPKGENSELPPKTTPGMPAMPEVETPTMPSDAPDKPSTLASEQPLATKDGGQARVVATGQHRVTGTKKHGSLTLWSNGHIGKPDGPGTWERNGAKLLLHWPGGVTDVCTLSPDGHFHGRNQRNKDVHVEGSLDWKQ